MKDKENLKWTKKNIAHQYKIENPEWAWKYCWDKANAIYKELNKLNNQTHNNNKRFFDMNTPFSFYYDRDGEFGYIHELRNGG